MKLLFFYIFNRVAVMTLGLLLILIGVVWLTQSLRFIEVIVNHNVSLLSYLSLIMYLIPDLLSSILPISFLIAGIYIFHKFRQDNELTVFHTIGMSPFQIYAPIGILSLLITALMLIINIYIVPSSFRHFRDQEHTIKNQFSSGLIHEGVFNFIKGSTVYVKEREMDGGLVDVFIQQNDKNTEITIIAERGNLKRMDKSLVMVLTKGQRQEKDLVSGHVSQFSFDELSYDLTAAVSNTDERTMKPYEKPVYELLNPSGDIEGHVRARMRAEGHQRLLNPVLAILDGVIVALFLTRISSNRKKIRKSVVFMGICGLLIHGGLFSLLNMSVQKTYFVWISYCLVFGLIFFGILSLLAFSHKQRVFR